jgi:AI-2 transport protein TqsA
VGDEVRHEGAAARVLKALAAVVILAAGLKIAAPLLLPIVVAGCLTLVALPAQRRLVGWGLPKGLAILCTVLGAMVTLAAFTSLLTSSLSLSPLVVLLSLLVWGWLWGPVGMLLSVPLTSIVRTLLLKTKNGRALAILLGPRT